MCATRELHKLKPQKITWYLFTNQLLPQICVTVNDTISKFLVSANC